MAKGTNQKLKLMYLARILAEETDEEHGLTLAEITSRLADCDINADRKTLYADFEELRHFGMDIISEKSGGHHVYKLVSRDFELPELKLLVDCVQAAKFISEKKSSELIKKLEGLTSRIEARQLQRQVLISGRVKTMNESIYYNVDKLHSAINANVQVRFKYFNWNVKKEMELRRGGAWYVMSPWHLVWDDEYYYLVAYDGAEQKTKHFRVDKMLQIELTDLPREHHKKAPATATVNDPEHKKVPVTVNDPGHKKVPVTVNDPGHKKAPVTVNDLELPRKHGGDPSQNQDSKGSGKSSGASDNLKQAPATLNDLDGMCGGASDIRRSSTHGGDPDNWRDTSDGFDINAYSKALFGMFGGEKASVTIEADNSLAGVIIDRFGKDTMLVPLDDGRFRFTVTVQVSEQFFGWVLSFGSLMRVVSPEAVVERLRRQLADMSAVYTPQP